MLGKIRRFAKFVKKCHELDHCPWSLPKIMATGSDFDSQSQSAKPVQRIDISTVEVGRLNWLSITGALGFVNPAIVFTLFKSNTKF